MMKESVFSPRGSLVLGTFGVFLSSLLMSCDDDDELEKLGRSVITIEVTEGELQPSEVTVRAPDENFIDVVNKTDEVCYFTFGPWVRELEVPANGQNSIGFAVTAIEGEPTTMGCDGGGPQGSVIVRESTSTEEDSRVD